MKFIHTLALALIGFAVTNCAPYDSYNNGSIYGGNDYLTGFNNPNGATQQQDPRRQPTGYWDGDGVAGPPKIVISRGDQSAYFYKGNKLVGVTPISTGTDGHTTPGGSFKVTQKSPNHSSSLYGIIKNRATGQTVIEDADTRKHKAGPGEVFVHAPMPNFLRYDGAVGMHAGFLPGYPASHGCVRLPERMAKIYYDNAPLGTPVIVK